MELTVIFKGIGFIGFLISSILLCLYIFSLIASEVRSFFGGLDEVSSELNRLSENEKIPYSEHVYFLFSKLSHDSNSSLTRNLLLFMSSSILLMILATLLEILEKI